MNKKWFWLGIILAVLLIFFGSFWGYRWYSAHKNLRLRQAVFLTNGQVYFGNISNEKEQIVKLNNIYYLKTQDSLQPNTDTSNNKKISLVKLGNELHGPTDEMRINRDQILFIENIRSDSKINQAIEKYSQSNSQ